ERCIAMAKACWLRGAHILDAGCGTGALSSSLWRVTGIDIAPGMCRLAHKKNNAVTNADVVSLPFADHSFDGVFSSLMLQWVSEPKRALAEMARVVKPGGRVVIS